MSPLNNFLNSVREKSTRGTNRICWKKGSLQTNIKKKSRSLCILLQQRSTYQVHKSSKHTVGSTLVSYLDWKKIQKIFRLGISEVLRIKRSISLTDLFFQMRQHQKLQRPPQEAHHLTAINFHILLKMSRVSSMLNSSANKS